MELIACALVLIASLIFRRIFGYFRKRLDYWNVRGVPNSNPCTPLGDLLKCFTGRKSLFDLLEDCYEEHRRKGCKFAGLYFMSGPVFVPIDTELIKTMLIRDHEHFNTRGVTTYEKYNRIFDNMFSQDYPRCAFLRKTVASAFSPSNVKSMVPIVEHYTDILLGLLGKSVDFYPLAQRYTLDVASGCFLGVSEENMVTEHTKVLKFVNRIDKCNLMDLAKVVWKMGVSDPGNLFTTVINGKEANDALCEYVSEAYKMRKKSKMTRGDVLDGLIKYIDDETEQFDLDTLAAQMFILLGGSFSTTASTLTYTLYEIAKDECVQNRVRADIEEALEKLDGKLTLDDINNLNYLDSLILETLRLHRVLPLLLRQCSKDYKIPGSNVVIEKGTRIAIATSAIQHNPDNYEDPEMFDPERFLDPPEGHLYMSFGIGSKACIGKRLAMIITKMAVIGILRRFVVTINPKTGLKLEHALFTTSTIARYKNTIWLDFEPIQ